MIAHLETVLLQGRHYLTELAYNPKMPTTGQTIHFFVHHPGASDVDALFKEADPSYQAPIRYHPVAVIRQFLSDYKMMSKGHAVFVPRKELELLHGFVKRVTDEDPEVRPPTEYCPLEDYYRPITISAIMRELANARHRRFAP